MKPSKFFTKEQKQQITDAIREAELNTSGEIRLHVEKKCKIDVLDRAAYIFDKLNMQKTEKRNGVLFYLSLEDHKFAILGDAGINAVTPDDFWDEIKDTVLSYFKENKYAEGLVKGIRMAGEALQEYFPYQTDDVNELSNEISYGKDIK
ncbi:MAG: TPM domain-containing protein [Bacteroidales bacterium]